MEQNRLIRQLPTLVYSRLKLVRLEPGRWLWRYIPKLLSRQDNTRINVLKCLMISEVRFTSTWITFSWIFEVPIGQPGPSHQKRSLFLVVSFVVNSMTMYTRS